MNAKLIQLTMLRAKLTDILIVAPSMEIWEIETIYSDLLHSNITGPPTVKLAPQWVY